MVVHREGGKRPLWMAIFEQRGCERVKTAVIAEVGEANPIATQASKFRPLSSSSPKR